MTRGTPDLILCINGKFIAFELKVGLNDLEPAQRVIKNKIQSCYGAYFAPRTLEEFIKTVDYYVQQY